MAIKEFGLGFLFEIDSGIGKKRFTEEKKKKEKQMGVQAWQNQTQALGLTNTDRRSLG